MWLYNRDKTLSEIERTYYSAVRDNVIEAVQDAFESFKLEADERQKLLAAAQSKESTALGTALIQIINDSSRQDSIEQRTNEESDNAVTYTADVALILLMSSNADAYQDVDPDGASDEFKAAMAYAADMRELLNNEHTMTEAAREVLQPWAKNFAPSDGHHVLISLSAQDFNRHAGTYFVRPRQGGWSIGGALRMDFVPTLVEAKTIVFEHALSTYVEEN